MTQSIYLAKMEQLFHIFSFIFIIISINFFYALFTHGSGQVLIFFTSGMQIFQLLLTG